MSKNEDLTTPRSAVDVRESVQPEASGRVQTEMGVGREKREGRAKRAKRPKAEDQDSTWVNWQVYVEIRNWRKRSETQPLC